VRKTDGFAERYFAEYAIDLKQSLHAEHRLTLHKPLPSEGHIISRHDIMGVRDKGHSAMRRQRKAMIDADTNAPIWNCCGDDNPAADLARAAEGWQHCYAISVI
jgi:hypothetical protein